MDAERWRRISSVFDQLCELPECERTAMLEVRCGDDPELRREVIALLEADASGNALDVHVPKLCLARGRRLGARFRGTSARNHHR